MDFTYGQYKVMIEKLFDNGYSIIDYSEANKRNSIEDDQKKVILRHDIDLSIEKAVEMARIENQLGVKSTFFVLLTSPLYNIFHSNSRELLLELMDLGHNVELHFDETQYDIKTDDEYKRKVLFEKEILETAMRGNYECNVVSMHMPSKRTLDANYDFNGQLINSYSALFFTNYKYVSDSNMHWRENVIEHIENENIRDMHILTHPIWWNQEAITKQEILKGFMDKRIKDIREKTFNIAP